jgi:hypothetical protein
MIGVRHQMAVLSYRKKQLGPPCLGKFAGRLLERPAGSRIESHVVAELAYEGSCFPKPGLRSTAEFGGSRNPTVEFVPIPRGECESEGWSQSESLANGHRVRERVSRSGPGNRDELVARRDVANDLVAAGDV